jgi:hypothetical protein
MLRITLCIWGVRRALRSRQDSAPVGMWHRIMLVAVRSSCPGEAARNTDEPMALAASTFFVHFCFEYALDDEANVQRQHQS